MKELFIVLGLAATTLHAQSGPCDLRQSEQQVRGIIEKVMALRSQQDDRFLSFYASDEYSFPGESWVFQGQQRSAQRTRDTRSARQSGTIWQMQMRDLHMKAGCEMSWVAGIVHVRQVDSHGVTTSEAEWRLTAVLERRDSGWQIVHQHSSLPISDPQQWWKLAQISGDRKEAIHSSKPEVPK
jgi:ketosteroid isomerase-like protein